MATPTFITQHLDSDNKMSAIHLSLETLQPTIQCGWVEFNNEYQTWGITVAYSVPLPERDFQTFDEAKEALIVSLEPILTALIKKIVERDRFLKSKQENLINPIPLKQATLLREEGVVFERAFSRDMRKDNAYRVEVEFFKVICIVVMLLTKGDEPYVL